MSESDIGYAKRDTGRLERAQIPVSLKGLAAERAGGYRLTGSSSHSPLSGFSTLNRLSESIVTSE